MGNKAKIRPMIEDDIEQVLVLEKENFATPWHKEHFEYELRENPFSHLYILYIDAEIIGYYGIWTTFEECQVTTIAVKDGYKGQGYGHMLMRSLLHEAKVACCERITLEVRVSNVRAQNLYTQYGFETINIRKGYYEDNHEDAYLMMKGI